MGRSQGRMGAEGSSLARVVVVDDDRLIREMARDALAAHVRVECCASAEEALEALRREPADLVISDLAMEGLSGIDLLGRVRREHPGTDFVVLTAHSSVESAVAALRMGAEDYLRKPIRLEELHRATERILSRRRLIDENERLREALGIAESCRTLTRCLEASEVYSVALDLLLHALSRSRGVAVYRRNPLPMSDGLDIRGFGEAAVQALREQLGGEKPMDLDAYREIRVETEGPLHAALRAARLPTGPALVVPLRGRELELGALWFLEDGIPFEGGEIERARLIAGHASVALQNAERYSHAKERAFVDDVTEVYNARYLHQAVEREIQRAERYERELCVLFLDLDHFKLVNDEFGHLVGSQVLRRLSEVLRSCIRQVDTLARYGGDEFTIALVDTGPTVGMTVAERIRRMVAETVFEGGRDRPIRLTISIGVAAYPHHGRERERLLDQADKAMYRAKSLGRNRVCSAAELPG